MSEEELSFYNEYKDATVSREEAKLYDRYVDAVYADAKRRIGDNIAAYDVVVRAQRLCKLMALGSFGIVIDNEARLLAPLKSIVYFQSDLKYINIVLANGKQERIYSKLSDVAPYMNSDFLRIHKSYFVNKKYVRSVSKSDKMITLKNDNRLPISEANYKAVIDALGEKSVRREKQNPG